MKPKIISVKISGKNESNKTTGNKYELIIWNREKGA